MRFEPRRLGVAFGGALAAWLISGAARAQGPVETLDLSSLFGASFSTVADRQAAYDTLVAAACVQGIANRSAPNLYLHYAAYNGIDTDQYWFTKMSDSDAGAGIAGAGILSGRTNATLATVDDAIAAYASQIAGLVVWDENVPATVNAAFTAAGADNLIAVRWDASPSSLYGRLTAAGMPVKVWLVNQDGSSLFLDNQGSANVPGTTRQTSQDAKADVYVWTELHYLTTGKLDPTEFGYMLDGFWINAPYDYATDAGAPTSQLQVTNRDWLVAKKGFPFDLSPWKDVPPTDDPTQPVGTDPAILNELFTSARSLAGDSIITVRGFFGWEFKYTTLEGLDAGHDPTTGEWTSVKLVSPYAAGLDADAPSLATMANASFFAHVPLTTAPVPQARPTPEDLVGEGFLSGLAANGGFEDQLTGWTVQTSNSALYSDDVNTGARAHSGLTYLECSTTNPSMATENNLYRDGPGVGVGTTVTMRGFVRAPGSPVSGTFTLSGLGGTTESASTAFTATSSWSEVRVTLPIANAGHTSTRGQIALSTANENLDLDDVAFYAGDAAAGSVEPATYALWFVGDYDSAAWIYAFSPTIWDVPGRGVVPLAWDFSGQVAARIPPFFRYALATRTPRDFFVGADSGPGYGNPQEMAAPARALWTAAGMNASRYLDSSAGWVLNPLDALDTTHLEAATPYYGDGVLLQAAANSVATPSIVDHAPVISLANLGGNGSTSPSDAGISSTAWILDNIPTTPTTPVFNAFRAVLLSTEDITRITTSVVTGNPSRKVRFVDPYSFFELARREYGGDNKHRASYLGVDVPSPSPPGAPVHVTLTVHNDGWETWSASGANAYQVGFNVSAAPPMPRTLPMAAGAYPVRAALTANVPPGGTAPIAVDLPAQSATGSYTLEVDTVEEGDGGTWFEMQGDIPLQVPLVVANPVIADAGGEVDSGHADATPHVEAGASDALAMTDAATMDSHSPDARDAGAKAPDASVNARGATLAGEGASAGCACTTGAPERGTSPAGFIVAMAAVAGALTRRRSRPPSSRRLWRSSRWVAPLREGGRDALARHAASVALSCAARAAPPFADDELRRTDARERDDLLTPRGSAPS